MLDNRRGLLDNIDITTIFILLVVFQLYLAWDPFGVHKWVQEKVKEGE